jgi:hypothetical protein
MTVTGAIVVGVCAQPEAQLRRKIPATESNGWLFFITETPHGFSEGYHLSKPPLTGLIWINVR